MIEISFNEPIDAAYVFEHLQKRLKKQIQPYFLRKYKTQSILINFPQNTNECIKQFLIPVLIHFIISQKEYKWVRSILHTSFYYEEDEIQQILPIAQSLLRGKRKSIPNQKRIRKSKHLLYAALVNYLQKSVRFNFESFVTFRLREYYKQLLYVSEIAIDEYKLENEYQNFIENLRQQIIKKESVIPYVHVVYNGKFVVYDEYMMPISYETLKGFGQSISDFEYLDRELIAPLTALAPQKIYLYTTTVDLAIIVTLQNIFQERVSIHTLQEFTSGQSK